MAAEKRGICCYFFTGSVYSVLNLLIGLHMIINFSYIPLGPPFHWETQQASFPIRMLGPLVGIFLSPLNTNDGFYLSFNISAFMVLIFRLSSF